MATCPHMPPAGTGRTRAQNHAFHAMKAKLGHDRAYSIVRDVTDGDDHSCTTTKEQMHEILNRMRLALGESPARHNHERRRRMVHPRRVPQGTPRVMTARQAEYIEDLAQKCRFGARSFESWCQHYIHKARPETAADARKLIEMLKPMAVRGWRPDHTEDSGPAGGRSGEPADILFFHPPTEDEAPF